jgi:hypothetical protein
MPNYRGSCHCGAVKFSFSMAEEITSGLSCNCSYCERRAAIMLNPPLADAELERTIEGNALSCYQFGNKVAKHYFCNQCGNYTFHETMRKPGYFRVNLGCVDGVESFELDREVFNGKELL